VAYLVADGRVDLAVVAVDGAHGWSLRLRLPPEAVATEPRRPSRHRLLASEPRGGGRPDLLLPAKPHGGHPQHVVHLSLHTDERCGDLAGGARASPGGVDWERDQEGFTRRRSGVWDHASPVPAEVTAKLEVVCEAAPTRGAAAGRPVRACWCRQWAPPVRGCDGGGARSARGGDAMLLGRGSRAAATAPEVGRMEREREQ
jgi:hypothetical protein